MKLKIYRKRIKLKFDQGRKGIRRRLSYTLVLWDQTLHILKMNLNSRSALIKQKNL